MINTVNSKEQQLRNGYFKIGSGSEVILIVGSCRSVPYCNYFNKYNEQNGNRFTICFIDPYNWCFDLQDNRVNIEEKINSLETDEALLNLFKSVKYFCHEYYANYGLFNCDRNENKNIYQFGLTPKVDICIPNWNNLFVLFGDIVSFDIDMRKKAIADYNVLGKLSDQTAKEIYEISQKGIERFYDVCMKSDLPEMKEIFRMNFIFNRFFWTHNHVSKFFTKKVFDLISEKIGLNLSSSFYDDQIDMFANNYTYLTEYDMKFYNYQWNEQIVPLRNKLF